MVGLAFKLNLAHTLSEAKMNRSIGIVAIFLCVFLLFGSGFLVGRRFPIHHYEQFGQSVYLYDTNTGKICTTVKTDPFAAYGGHETDPPAGSQLDKPSSSSSVTYPFCGEQ
jgi:hypothetical protein